MRGTDTFNCNHLFGMRPMRGHISIHDVRDAYAIAQSIPARHEREALYACYGLDMERVETWYPQVDYLERCWNASQDAEKQKKQFVLRFGNFVITHQLQ